MSADAAGSPGQAGLSSSEVAERLRRDGPNELPQDGRRGLLHIVLEAVRELMLKLLLVAARLYLLLGDLTEGLVLLGFAVLNVLLVVMQENRTERPLAALRDLTSPRALVVRDGERRRISVYVWGLVGSDAEREALRVGAEAIPGVKGFEDQTIPYLGARPRIQSHVTVNVAGSAMTFGQSV